MMGIGPEEKVITRFLEGAWALEDPFWGRLHPVVLTLYKIISHVIISDPTICVSSGHWYKWKQWGWVYSVDLRRRKQSLEDLS
jgi:hypothetical protein